MFKIEPFNLNTCRPLPLPSGVLNSKKGYYVEWKGIQAELSPLEALSNENIEDCLNELKAYEEYFNQLDDIFIPDELFFGQSFPCPKNTAVLFCLESLIIQGHIKNKSIRLPVNYMGTVDDLKTIDLSQFHDMCIKVKVAKSSLDEEKKLLVSIPNNIKLRIDGNQKLTLPLPDYYRELNLDYIEEPFKEIKHYNELDLPFALDENIQNWKLINNPQLKALVVKPSLHLSLSGSFKLAKEAAAKGIKLVVSSAYETPVGLYSLFLLADMINEKLIKTEHGLNGLDWYEVNAKKLTYKNGILANF